MAMIIKVWHMWWWICHGLQRTIDDVHAVEGALVSGIIM